MDVCVWCTMCGEIPNACSAFLSSHWSDISHPTSVTFIEFFHMNKSVRGISRTHTIRIFLNTYISLTCSRFQQIYSVLFSLSFLVNINRVSSSKWKREKREREKKKMWITRAGTNELKWDTKRSGTFAFVVLYHSISFHVCINTLIVPCGGFFFLIFILLMFRHWWLFSPEKSAIQIPVSADWKRQQTIAWFFSTFFLLFLWQTSLFPFVLIL